MGRARKPPRGKVVDSKDRATASDPTLSPLEAGSPLRENGGSAPRAAVAPGAVTLGAKLSASVGIIAAMVLAVLVNVLVTRHYARWDWTGGGLYTLSEPTRQTLRALEEPLRVHVLLPANDPLALSVQHLLEAYRAETSRIEVKVTDPDRHPAEFLAVQQRFGVRAGRTEDGRIVTDASIIVARGDRPYFITSRDLVHVEDEDDARARPRLEHALTGAIRSLLGDERPRICFTAGHGERSTEEGGTTGLATLRERLTKNNYDVVEVVPARAGEPASELGACRLLVVAGPSERVAPAEVARWRTFVEEGGSALVAVGPVPNESDQGYQDLGLDAFLGLFGVKLAKDFVFELDPKRRSTQGFGETLLPDVRPHATTEGLVRAADRGLPVILTVTSSLNPTGEGAAAVSPLLVTSERAFGMVDFFRWAQDPSLPAPKSDDHLGPLTVAAAAELPARPGSSAPHGSRLVVVASPSALFGANWQTEELRGTSLFVESSISWLAARPAMLELPDKPSFTAGTRLTEESMGSILRYVVVYIPLAVALLGLAVHLRRRGTERRGTKARENERERAP